MENRHKMWWPFVTVCFQRHILVIFYDGCARHILDSQRVTLCTSRHKWFGGRHVWMGFCDATIASYIQFYILWQLYFVLFWMVVWCILRRLYGVTSCLHSWRAWHAYSVTTQIFHHISQKHNTHISSNPSSTECTEAIIHMIDITGHKSYTLVPATHCYHPQTCIHISFWLQVTTHCSSTLVPPHSFRSPA